MPKFFLKRRKVTFQIRPSRTVLATNQQGSLMAVEEAGEFFTVLNGFIETNDPKIVERLRKDATYGTDELYEMKPEDEKAIEIKKKYDRLADEEIKKFKKEEVQV